LELRVAFLRGSEGELKIGGVAMSNYRMGRIGKTKKKKKEQKKEYRYNTA
jgi:hypothetical protein